MCSANPDQPEDAREGTAEFRDFLLQEYQNIANAHFNTVSTLTTFFKHYLVIVTIPVSIIAVLLSKGVIVLPKTPTVLCAVSAAAIMLYSVGSLILIYMTNLRFDAILYARTVNGIRAWFYRRSSISLVSEQRLRVLPTSTLTPPYFEAYYFLPVVVSCGLLNGIYGAAGVYGLASCLFNAAAFLTPIRLAVIAFGLSAAANILVYRHLARRRDEKCEHAYSWRMGVDIDGVLNRHRDHFSKHLKQECGKQLSADEITHIPVHTIPGTDVDKKDEMRVFNTPSYWVDMPAMEEAADALKQIKATMCVKIILFTNRDWPSFEGLSTDEVAKKERLWRRKPAIEVITKRWLKEHGFDTKNVNVNKGKSKRETTREFQAMAGKLDILVEDNPETARKLARYCKLVILMDHPYNQSSDLPKNVIRVKGWGQIVEILSKAQYDNGGIHVSSG